MHVKGYVDVWVLVYVGIYICEYVQGCDCNCVYVGGMWCEWVLVSRMYVCCLWLWVRVFVCCVWLWVCGSVLVVARRIMNSRDNGKSMK